MSKMLWRCGCSHLDFKGCLGNRQALDPTLGDGRHRTQARTEKDAGMDVPKVMQAGLTRTLEPQTLKGKAAGAGRQPSILGNESNQGNVGFELSSVSDLLVCYETNKQIT